MFTDDQATPVRLEILVDLMSELGKPTSREDVCAMLQPVTLADDSAPLAARATLKAGIELGLIKESEKLIHLDPKCRKFGSARAAILEAIDDRVLGTTEVEKYFALFYSFYLGLGKEANSLRWQKNDDKWVEQFNRAVFRSEHQANPFNSTKLTGLHRWMNYAGLGWYDPEDIFQANPYDRLRRSFPVIFKGEKSLDSGAFMAALARACPELDGGEIFAQANPGYQPKDKRCTLGLSQALIELHLDGIIRLKCPPDNIGWSISDAEPSSEGLASNHIASVEIVGRS